MNNQITSILFMLLSKNDIDYFLIYVIIFMIYLNDTFNFTFIEKFLSYYINQNNSFVNVTISSYDVQIVKPFVTTICTKTIYSDDFLSIIHYLNKYKKNLFNEFLEILSFNGEGDYNVTKKGIEYNNSKFTYIPISINKVLIDDKNDIYVEINYEFINENNDLEDKNKSKKKIKKFYLKIYVKKNKNNNEYLIINNFIDKCKKEFEIDNSDDLTKQYIFEYIGVIRENDNMILEFNKYLMEHNKDLRKNIFFDKKEKLLNYIEPFIYDPKCLENEGEKLYKRSGFTFKAGILFYGSPGCGKSSTIKGILKETNRHGIIVNLNKVKTNQELEKIFRDRYINGVEYSCKQLCYILEDCDAFENNILCSREEKNIELNNTNTELKQLANLISRKIDSDKINIEKYNIPEDNINLSCFLNILDGIIELNGIMIIMTTNHPEKIDKALIRPGRFDFKYEFKKATLNVLKQMLQFKYNISSSEIDKFTDLNQLKDHILSPAEIQSICFKNNNIVDCINEIIIAYQK